MSDAALTHPTNASSRINYHADLPTGRISVEVHASDVAAEELFGFAQRRNPKRAFLFVSRVLGRHIPVSPTIMRATFLAMAAKIPCDLPGPVLIMGLAETAVGLGAGVHREWCRITGRDDAVYLPSTRHPLCTSVLAHFSEDHSHATTHLVHQPADSSLHAMVVGAGSLVLVDDEITTGQTLANLRAALKNAGIQGIRKVVLATITDWSAGSAGDSWGEPVETVSLLSGRFTWAPREGASIPCMPHVDVTAPGTIPLDPRRDWGRMGIRRHPEVAAGPGFLTSERVLVLGTGEHVWRPFLLAEALEQIGCDVSFSAVTRSPIALGHAIDSALCFRDSYGIGIPNFAYNVDPAKYDRILLCTETPPECVDPAFVRALGPALTILSEAT
ncbi:phosphoribosyltransferase domain-containing protein [Methylobacterium sp. 37f]|uniref:phosphoribosyltransferase domain-containing protein n=1 Tax=Methylobacterium sp. 37f TaxID=2817058 RepID=UPI001FFC4353|nr:phosphoribosyltransferase domain-containing protein [Methylobacterium sp. 37f]MCK2055273.1 phosphoribosyltransferase domain-containing protein [Methylobacterium sp. 37f]